MLKNRHYRRQHPDQEVAPLSENDNTTPILEPNFVPKTGFTKGNNYASSECKSQAQIKKSQMAQSDIQS